MQQTLVWVKTWTAVWVLIALAAAFVTGAVLRLLVRRSAIHPSRALHIIKSISVLVGGAVGSVIVLLLLIILWPAAGNWIINTRAIRQRVSRFSKWLGRGMALGKGDGQASHDGPPRRTSGTLTVRAVRCITGAASRAGGGSRSASGEDRQKTLIMGLH